MLGSWGIWIDVLPALGFLQTVEIWADDTVTPAVSVTLASVLVSLVWVVMTVLAAKNIPGALEMLVLQRLKIRPGERNAITTITRYALLLIGIVGAFSAIGIGWGKVQWLAAAVSVGLGFGLQEIFANFVSGLIILFERPVRVGDLVTVGTATVGTTDGFVTRIQMRATTVTDFNRRELIIPNKQFITGSIINWSLSDPMIRVVVKVGVAFGTDTEKAKKILLQIADANPLILKRPEPMAVFTQFGESTLDLELRAFLPSRDERPQASDELHTRIDVEFRKAGIEIALPQRDINVRTETAAEWMRGQGAQTTPPAGEHRRPAPSSAPPGPAGHRPPR
jgi:potassium efflux system protein